MEYTQEARNELLYNIQMAIAINNDTFNNEIKKIFINSKALILLQDDYYLHSEGYATMFGYPVQIYYDNQEKPEFYLGI